MTVEEKAKSLAELVGSKVPKKKLIDVLIEMAAWQRLMDAEGIKSKAMHHCEEGWEIGKLEMKEQLTLWLTRESRLMHDETGRGFSKQYRQVLCKEIIEKIEELVK